MRYTEADTQGQPHVSISGPFDVIFADAPAQRYDIKLRHHPEVAQVVLSDNFPNRVLLTSETEYQFGMIAHQRIRPRWIHGGVADGMAAAIVALENLCAKQSLQS